MQLQQGMTEHKRLLRERIAHLVNKYMGEHIRKAVFEYGMPPPDGSFFISALLNDPDILIKAESQLLPMPIKDWRDTTAKEAMNLMVKKGWRRVE